MLKVYCDSCKKELKDSIKDVNYVNILDKAVCSSCKEKYEGQVSRAMMSRKKKYAFLEQKKLLLETLNKICR